VQELATSEAGKMLMVVSANEDVQEDNTAEPETAEPEATLGNPVSPTHSIVNVESDSSSSSLSTSSSSSTDTDDVLLGQLYPSIQKCQSTKTKTYKKPS
jgi:hypothetical protein